MLGILSYTLCKKFWKTTTFLHLGQEFYQEGGWQKDMRGVGQIAPEGGVPPAPLKNMYDDRSSKAPIL